MKLLKIGRKESSRWQDLSLSTFRRSGWGRFKFSLCSSNVFFCEFRILLRSRIYKELNFDKISNRLSILSTFVAYLNEITSPISCLFDRLFKNPPFFLISQFWKFHFFNWKISSKPSNSSSLRQNISYMQSSCDRLLAFFAIC